MKKLILIGIIVLASILRFYKLDSLPALNADEAAIGYNTYSLLETGKDEHGNSWPIHFQSFNDHKPGLYFYLVIPFIKLMGLSEWSVRLPGAILGVATVFLVWLLVRELFPHVRNFSLFTFHFSLAEIAALFLAISPWHLHFSRGGWEVNAGTFFILLGLWSFLRGLKDSRWVYIAAVSWTASLYTYHSARIVVPLLTLVLIIVNRSLLFNKARKTFLAAVVLSAVLLIPLAKDLFGPAGISRASGVGLFADPGPLNKVNVQRGEHEDIKSISSKLLHNKPVNYGLAFAQNDIEHFDGDFLFISSDKIERNKVPDMGLLYLFDLPLLVIGLLTISKNMISKNTKGWGPILLWLILSPTAAALTFQSPHALRAQNMVVPLVIISSYGAWSMLNWLNRHISRKYILITCHLSLVTFMIWNFTYYLHQYYLHMNKEYDYSSQYGVKELVAYTRSQKDYENFFITSRYDQPYILFLFYLKYPPEKFQSEHTLTSRDQFGFSTVESFDNYLFGNVSDWEGIKIAHPKTLIAGAPNEVPDGERVIHTIYFPSGRVAFEIVEN